ncbi:hypothetical protein [Persicirhabdus sediminis]|uniref:hypothetical protein n=1 Tax=Persicirhabdus sediminis TaxID=454144 RepID=UPI001F341523|nr:hypothetical protein [Persicirhabdus sediminis]
MVPFSLGEIVISAWDPRVALAGLADPRLKSISPSGWPARWMFPLAAERQSYEVQLAAERRPIEALGTAQG